MSSSSSSSLSSLIGNTIPINGVLLLNGHNPILPFTYCGEDSFIADGSVLQFKFRTSTTSYFDYSNIINPQQQVDGSTFQTYMPETDDARYVHSPIFFVDLITDDKSGVSKISARGQFDYYETRKPTYTFVIPRFSWKTTDIKRQTNGVSSIVGYLGAVWIGTLDKTLYKVEYSDTKANAVPVAIPKVSTSSALESSSSESLTQFMDSELMHIEFNPDNNLMYLTSYDHLRKCSIDSYLSGDGSYTMNFNVKNIIYNDSNKQIVYNKENDVWAVNSYSGTINKLDLDTLNDVAIFYGFDAPFKIMKSNYHNFYIVAGTNMLWKFDGVNQSSIKPIYSIADYKISDFDICKNGEIAITMTGVNDSIFRILDKNFYRILFNKDIYDGEFRFCKYCSTKNKVYAIAELLSGTSQYGLSHYLYDLTSGNVFNEISNNAIQSNESSSSDVTPTTKVVEITRPIGGEIYIYGQKITIKWKSTQSVTSLVNIDLYKNGIFSLNIATQITNSGNYDWTILDTIESGSDYTIKITWVAPPPNNYSDTSPATFVIDSAMSSSSGFIIPISVGDIAGVDFDPINENVVVIVKHGYLGFFDTNMNKFNGLFNLEVPNISCIAVRNDRVKEFDTVTKVRIFVGTQKYLSDKWDSGEVETNLTAMYYGGGNNLNPGEKYYVNVQVYSSKTGWSEVQTREFLMPCKPDNI